MVRPTFAFFLGKGYVPQNGFLGIPIALRVVYRDKFVRGPFHLGAFSFPVAVLAVTWIAFITIAFILPNENVRRPNSFSFSCFHRATTLMNHSPLLARDFSDVELCDSGSWNCRDV